MRGDRDDPSASVVGQEGTFQVTADEGLEAGIRPLFAERPAAVYVAPNAKSSDSKTCVVSYWPEK